MQDRGWCFWAVEVPNVAKFIGMIGLDTVDFPVHFTPAVEIGWRLAFDHWGHGYATEGARASLQYGFQTLKLKEVGLYGRIQSPIAASHGAYWDALLLGR
jgi:3-dehydroquinate dehydratase/shikimate dehydrogenase